jgi:hypothetical protein
LIEGGGINPALGHFGFGIALITHRRQVPMVQGL